MRWFLMLCGLAGTTYLLLDGRESAHGTASFEVGRPFAATARTSIADLRRGLQGPVLRVAGLPAQTPVRGTPSFAASSEDPWIDGPPPCSAPTREAHAHAPAVSGAEPVPRWKVWRPRGDGERDGAWTTWRGPRPPADAAIPRVHYDLAAMVPTYGGWLPALAGRTPEPRVHLRGTSIWRSLALRIQRRIADAARSHEGCSLACDNDHPILIVRAPQYVHDEVVDLLDAADRQLRSVRTLSLERSGAERLRVDVAAWRSVRSVRGDAVAYLMDYDVEVSQDAFISDPILGRVEGGIGLAVRRWFEGDEERVHVTVSRSTGPAQFTPYTSEMNHWEPCDIELPEAPADTWTRTLVDPSEGGQPVVVGGHALGRLVVGPQVDPEPDAPRRWRSQHEPVRSGSSRVGPLRVRVQGGRHGLLGVGVVRNGSGSGDTTILLRHPAGEGEAPVEGRAVLRLAWGGQLGAGQRIDATLTVGRRLAEERSVSASRPALHTSGRVAFELRLPTAALQVDTRMVALDRARQGAATFEADLGLGREEIRVLVAPHAGVVSTSALR